MNKRFLIPLAVFAVLVVFLGAGLSIDPKLVPSPLIDKPAPSFALRDLQSPDQSFSDATLKGDVSVLNVWASWCVACREEHQTLVRLSQAGVTTVYGLNYKDERDDALGWLDQFGNPYAASGHDYDGRVGIDWGVYGVPETFVVDTKGVIRYKHIGPLNDELVRSELIPLIRQLKAEAG